MRGDRIAQIVYPVDEALDLVRKARLRVGIAAAGENRGAKVLLVETLQRVPEVGVVDDVTKSTTGPWAFRLAWSRSDWQWERAEQLCVTVASLWGRAAIRRIGVVGKPARAALGSCGSVWVGINRSVDDGRQVGVARVARIQ